jgi:hypothetical protein
MVCFKEKPESTFSYNANFIYKSITEKYDIKKNKEKENAMNALIKV